MTYIQAPASCPECVTCPECGDVLYCLSETKTLPPCEHHGYCDTCRSDLCTRCINTIEATGC